MQAESTGARLNPWLLLVCAAPAAILVISLIVLRFVGQTWDFLPERLAEFDMYRESAARITLLAGLMLFVGAALGALAFFMYTLRMLERRSRLLLIVALPLLSAAALLAGVVAQTREAHDYVGLTLTCIAAGYDKPQSDAQRDAERVRLEAARPRPATASTAAVAQPDGVDTAALLAARQASPYCETARFASLRLLGQLQFIGVTLAFSALVFGAICCLATPGRLTGSRPPAAPVAAQSGTVGEGVSTASDPPPALSAEDQAMLAHWERQSQWLNTYLYLAALLLGTTMVFLNAYMRFPAYVLLDSTTFDSLIAAAVSYYGFVFTIMLAAFYIPVAVMLSNRVSALKPAAPGESKLPAAFQGPLQLLRIAIGLIAPAIAGVLANIIGVTGG